MKKIVEKEMKLKHDTSSDFSGILQLLYKD